MTAGKNLQRTPLLRNIVETSVPVDWPKKIGLPAPGMTRKKKTLPDSVSYDDSYPCTKEGKKIAKAHAWQFPSKRIKICGKILSY